MNKIGLFAAAALLVACSSNPTVKKPDVPALTPQTAATLLQFDNKAHSWMQYVQKHNTGCDYKVDLPDQANQPTEIDLDHIVSCAGRPASMEYNASVVFTYDKAQGRWVISRFSS